MTDVLWVDARAHRYVAAALRGIAAGTDWDVRELPGEHERPTTVDPLPVDSVAVMFWLHRNDRSLRKFFVTFDRYWCLGIRNFVVLAPDGLGLLPWNSLPAAARMAFEHYCRLLHVADAAELKTLVEAVSSPSSWAETRIRDTLAARRIYARIQGFAHGARGDLSNRFLAPARLMILAKEDVTGLKPVWQTVWSGEGGGGMAAVLGQFSKSDDRLAQELAAAGKPITDWFNDVDAALDAEVLGRFMGMLTECRVLAGEVSRAEGGGAGCAPGPLACSQPHNGRSFRVLVVDDHAESWKPVFATLQKLLATDGKSVEFYFSLDAEQFGAEEGRAAHVQYDSFDLVILDILLGPGRDGREILSMIRRSFAKKPILLWTTSRDEELTAKASRANGILLKKTLEWPAFRDTVTTWLMRRDFALPSPFFDDVIVKEDHRQLVRAMTDWCLKQLDSFHALDGSYFRYFTDHGGRHIVKLMELLEEALAPFLVNGSDVLSSDREQREFEFLSLYLTVVCHELGMFPMRIGEQVEDFSVVGDAYLDDVRSLHAPRGMVLLAGAGDGGFWSDADGRTLGKELAKVCCPEAPGLRLSQVLAVLVGYHARCFKSLDESLFLSWTADKRFAKLKSVTPTLQRADTLFKGTLEQLRSAITEGREGYCARLRRQCALFRFVDAIDIDSSRNPAAFLIHSPRRGAVQNREYLKRQVCAEIRVHRGEVVAKMLASPPDVGVLSKILSAMPELTTGGEYFAGLEDPEREHLGTFLKYLASASALPQDWNPWDPNYRLAIGVVQEPLDRWLERTWAVIMGETGADGLITALKEVGILDDTISSMPRLGKNAKKHLASLTAVSVAGEVLCEYRAIEDVNLHRELRLGRVEWTTETWSDYVAPEQLTILAKALGDYSVAKELPR